MERSVHTRRRHAERPERPELNETDDAAIGAISSRDTGKRTLDELWLEFEECYGGRDETYDTALSELVAGTGAALTSGARSLLDDLLAADNPAEVARLWSENPSPHAQLIAQHPDILGNLDGVAYDVRAQINRARLEDLLETEPEGPRREELAAHYRALKSQGVRRETEPHQFRS